MNVNEAKNSVNLAKVRKFNQSTADFTENQNNSEYDNYPNNYKNNLVIARARNRKSSKGGTLGTSAKSIAKVMEGPKWKAPMEALKLAYKLRKRVKEGENTPFLIALLVAIAIDFADATWFIGLFCKPFLFFFLWGKGTFKIKVTVRILLFIDCIPIISLLPLSTVCVFYAWHHVRKEVKKDKKKLEKIEKELGIYDRKKHKK